MQALEKNNDSAPADETHDAVNRQASVMMKRGMALMNEGGAPKLKEALANFDRAIALRQKLPLADAPQFRYGLAAGWLNRADALTRLGSMNDLAAAVAACDAALEILQAGSLDVAPLYRRRTAIAWQNRGLALQQRGQPFTAEAGKSFQQAIAVLQAGNAPAIADHHYLLTVVWLNYANVLILEGGWEPAREAALRAIQLARAKEADHQPMAETGLKARYIYCQAMAGLLEQAKTARKSELISQATDAVEEGLKLAQTWERRGVVQFRTQARDLFRFGTLIYQLFQPHFLASFLLENLDPEQGADTFVTDSHMHAAALESVWRTFSDQLRPGFKMTEPARFEEFLGKLRELRIVEERLTELRQKFQVE